MPYIPQSQRRFSKRLGVVRNSGELNYQFTLSINRYLVHNGLSYQSLNDIVGALECAKLEMYRRIASPHEDRKIAENGDVYTCTKGTI